MVQSVYGAPIDMWAIGCLMVGRSHVWVEFGQYFPWAEFGEFVQVILGWISQSNGLQAWFAHISVLVCDPVAAPLP